MKKIQKLQKKNWRFEDSRGDLVFGDNSSAPGVQILVEKIKLNYKYERCDDAKIAGYD